jgi:radical SAM-linked protein
MSTGSHSPAPPESSMPEQPALVAELHYAVRGDLRYLSHHDELRMLVRALTRAGWPLLYTRGFNPIPRLTLPLPRSTGIAADDQLALVDLLRDEPAEALAERARAALPADAPLLSVHTHLRRPAVRPRAVAFTVQLPSPEAETARAAAPAFLAAGEYFVDRDLGPGKPARRVEIRRFVRGLTFGPDGSLRMDLVLENQGSARPAEVLGGLGIVTQHMAAPTTRTSVDWAVETMSAAPAAHA